MSRFFFIIFSILVFIVIGSGLAQGSLTLEESSSDGNSGPTVWNKAGPNDGGIQLGSRWEIQLGGEWSDDFAPRKVSDNNIGQPPLNLEVPHAEYLEVDNPFESPLPEPGSGYKLILVVNNDTFTSRSTDRHLTNQIRIGAITQRVPGFLRRYIEENEFLVFTLSQDIYTPEDIMSEALVEDERPYAGYLYFTLGKVEQKEDSIEVTTIDLGIVGPSAQADRTQIEFHALRGLQRPNGWDNQLLDELAFNVNYDKTLRKDDGSIGDLPFQGGTLGDHLKFTERIQWELLHNYGLSLGTVNTSLRAGYGVRFGLGLPDDFGSEYGTKLSRKGWKVFADLRAQGEIVFQNVFLDGNREKESHRVEKEELVGEMSAGLTLQRGPFGFSIRQAVRSKEFEDQNGADRTGGFKLIVDYFIQ